MKNDIPYTLVDTAGQITAVVDVSVSRTQQPIIAKPIMDKIKNIGQVCFIERQGKYFRLQMMGDELSINGTLAGAFYLLEKFRKTKIKLVCSGLSTFIIANKDNNSVSIVIPKQIFGIKFAFVPGFVKEKIMPGWVQILKNLATVFPASGIIFYEANKIQPLIYVRATNTFVWENCCGSASIAYAIRAGYREILQPSGEKIFIKMDSETITYQTRVAIVS